MPSKNRIDPDSIPKEYLQAYPYPAFVLIAPNPDQQNAESSRSPHIGHEPFHPFEIYWSNSHWRNFAGENSLLECLDVDGARKLGRWFVRHDTLKDLTSSAEKNGLDLTDRLANFTLEDPPTDRSLPVQGGAPSQAAELSSQQEAENLYSPKAPLRPTLSAKRTNSIDGPKPQLPSIVSGPLIMDFVHPQPAKFELLKTYMPIWCTSKGNGRNKMADHSFVIITTIPRSDPGDQYYPIPVIEATPGQSSRDSPEDDDMEVHAGPTTKVLSPSGSPKHHTLTRPIPSAYSSDPSVTNKSITPTEELLEFDFGAKKSTAIRFGRDGAVTRPAQWNSKTVDVHDLMQSTDWAATPLGPRERWPQSLKTAASLVLHYPHQCCLWWGKDLTLIYNEAYAQMMHKHPHIFGMSGTIAWAEIWDALGPLSELVLSGTPVTKEDDFLLFKQLPHQGEGTIEEYHTWMWVPVLIEDGTFGGLWNATIATTSKVLAERRMSTVQEMGQRTSTARSMTEFSEAVIDILAANARDVPFAALYHVDLPSANTRRDSSGANSVEMTKEIDPSSGVRATVRLAGAVGIPENHPTTPSSLTVSVRSRARSSLASLRNGPRSPSLSISSFMSNAPLTSNSAYSEADEDEESMKIWPIKEALLKNRLVMVENCESMIAGFPIRVWDELPNAAVVVPIANESDDGVPSAVMILGLNLKRPFDEDYESFIHLLRVQLASGIAAVRSYEAEQQRVEELAALDRAKSLLFSNVSHELRTPLTLIAGPLDDLLQETAEGPKRENLVMARRNVRRLTRLVSTLMDVSRLEAGRLKGSFQLVNLGVVTRDLAVLFKGAMKQAKLEFSIDCDLSPQTVYIDSEHWEKVVFNLVGNAMKYTMEGFVRVKLRYSRGEAIFTVQDSGVGIPSTDIDLIGERFHRVQSVSRSHEGTGIGLALVKELIKLHGGVMSISSVTALESDKGDHGSTFSVRIPLGSGHLPPDAIEDEQIVSRPSQTTYGQGIIDEAIQWTKDRERSSTPSLDGSDVGSLNEESTSRGSKSLDPSTLYFKKEDVIMLVDDSFDTRRYMSSIFSPLCTIIEARDGLEAIRLCEKTVPDLIVSDVMMPNLDGFGLLEALKASKDTAIIPVIMLTARGGDEAKVDGLLAGADDYLAKPFNARELVARAHMQLQLGKRRRSLEEAFEQRTSELRALTEYSPVGIFRTTEDGTVTFTNNAWHDMSGYPMDEPVDRWAEFIAEPFRPMLLEFWDKVLNRDDDDQEISKSIDYQFTNGVWAQLKAIRLERLGDKVGTRMKGILGCVNDITERKLHEESQKTRVIEAEQRRKEAEEAKRQQELLIDITSHEIRNPISSLMQCSSLVKTNLLSLQEQLEAVHMNKTSFIPTKQLLNNIEEDLDALESIYQCGLAQERISNDVLSLGKIQLDKLQMFDVEVNMARETQKTLSIFQNEARMKRISLSLKFGEGLELLGLKTVKTDPVRLNQIVTNLLSNAIRFTSTSNIRKITLKFDVSLDPPAGDSAPCVIPENYKHTTKPGQIEEDQPVYLYFSVEDTGPGMTEAELELLFQRFSQVSLKTHTIFGGSGLGLFVCRQITHMMGGRIDVTSQKGKGTTFRFYIKARTCQPPPPPTASASATAEEGLKESGDLNKRSTLVKSKKKDIFQFEGKKPHVLIVEDNLINQTVLARQLKHCNITCDVASNGLEALEKIRKVSSTSLDPKSTDANPEQPFDCVLMDLEMPVMDGLTALDHIREEEASGKLKKNLVIALTGNARQGQIDEAKARGMDEVIIKPYRLDDMLQKVEEMMKIRAHDQDQDEMSTPTTPQLGSD